MKNEIYKVKAIILIMTFCFSLTLFWNVLALVFGDNKFYIVFQCMFAAYYTLLSVFLTSNIRYFRKFWEKHTVLKVILDKVLHYCAVIMFSMMTLLLIIPDVLFGRYKKEYGEIDKQETEKKIKDCDSMTLEARTLLPVGILVIIMIIFVGLDILTEQWIFWIQEIVNALVGIISLVFVIVSVKSEK